MRNIININENWQFIKNTSDISLKEGAVSVNLPHTWNAEDGFDGGNDYFRGACLYTKTISKENLPEADVYYLEFRGANSSADVYLNGKKLALISPRKLPPKPKSQLLLTTLLTKRFILRWQTSPSTAVCIEA